MVNLVVNLLVNRLGVRIRIESVNSSNSKVKRIYCLFNESAPFDENPSHKWIFK